MIKWKTYIWYVWKNISYVTIVCRGYIFWFLKENVVKQSMNDLLENLKGERTPDVSLAAHPKACLGCSVSGCEAIDFNCREREIKLLIL
jgi:hypothetical protein